MKVSCENPLLKKQNGIYNEFIIKEVSKNFSNNKILIENIPSAENIIMSGIEKKYLNIISILKKIH